MDTQKHTESSTSPDATWSAKYLAERKKARILGAATVAASLVAVGAATWGLGNADSGSDTGGPGTGQFAPPGMPGQDGAGGFIPGGPGAPSGLFDADGSVDEHLLAQLLDTIPGGDLQTFLDRQVEMGLLSQDQADAVAGAVGGTTNSEEA